MSEQAVLVFGGGEFGSCLAGIVRQNAPVHVWDIESAKRSSKMGLDEMCSQSSVVFLCVCSWHMRDALATLKQCVSPDTLLVSCAKGMTQDGKTMDQVIAELVPNRFVLISGPMIAETVCDQKLGFGVCAGAQDDCAVITALFTGTRIKIECAGDVRTIAWAGILKNIYAVFMGMVDALELGDNAKGYFISKILEEWDALADLLRLDRALLQGRAGQGDLVTTSISLFSRNRELGKQIVSGAQSAFSGEGLLSLGPVCAMVRGRMKLLPPLLEALESIIVKKQDPKTAMGKLL